MAASRHIDRKGSRLNRFLVAKQKEAKGEQESDGSERPPLHQLHTATDVKKWIPSIRREVNYLLRQISSTRDYPDRKIEEFKRRLDELKKEHQKYVAKVQRLDPSYKDTIPWQPRGYSRKRSHDNHVMSCGPCTSEAEGVASKKLCSPLLEKEQSRQSHVSHVNCNTSLTANDLEEKHKFDEETDISHTRSTKSSMSTNLLGLDYSSSEDES